MKCAIAMALSLTCAAGVSAQTPDVALVRATFSLEQHPNAGIDIYYEAAKRGLDANAVQYDIVTDEEIVEGALADYALAIFPFTIDTTEEHTAAIQSYVKSGGNLLWFFTVPPDLQETLGIAEMHYWRAEYPGHLHTMRFNDQAPAGFPEAVRQVSMSSQAVTETTEDARIIATWLNDEGEEIGIPAVILTDHSVWLSHVLWRDADAEAQHHLMLATIGHFVPGAWERIVGSALAGALEDAGYDSLEALVEAASEAPRAGALAGQAREQAQQARQALQDGEFGRALARAREFRDTAQRAAAATYPSRPYEMRGAWMGFPSDDTDWEAIMAELEAANFTALFPNMCNPGAAVYPSDYLPQITETDQMAACLDAARAHGIEVHVWRGNWQAYRAAEGVIDRFANEGRFVLSVEQAMGEEEQNTRYRWSRRWLDPSDERNRQLEIDAMVELVEKYHPDGIHYDFMRYPSARYCYCDRCRAKFEQWAEVEVEHWPEDCWEGSEHLELYRDWRRHLQTSLVAEVRERLLAIDPHLRISLAARASVTGAPENDAQDWITWAREGYLDFLCPMDYTGDVEVFRNKLEPQMDLVGGVVPVYPGIGVSPTRSRTPANLSEQIMLAREMGADGFLIFSLSSFSRQMLPIIAEGATATPVHRLPHHDQSVMVSFEPPPAMEGAPERTYRANRSLTLTVRLAATTGDAVQITAQPLVMPARGGEAVPLAEYTSADGQACQVQAQWSAEPGIWSVIARGETVFEDGHEEPFYLRSLPLTVLSEEEAGALEARLSPPRFKTDGLHVGMLAGGYGTEGMTRALSGENGVELRSLYSLAPEILAPCEVVIVPQLRQGPGDIGSEALAALRAYVRGGGGLLVTHDAVGVRGYEAPFPEVATGALPPVRETPMTVAAKHGITGDLPPGTSFTHSYYDHIALEPGEAGTVVLQDESGNAVAVCGDVGAGRYVAWGMATGLGSGDGEVEPQGAERSLLIAAVRWLGAAR
ncbi:MAG: family 10 glycosylhydrolase [Armatimonadota bacterium]|nr:family 10 glycosylhydrolase [Armatimonadota bacterium]